MEVYIRRYTSVHGFYFFELFPIGCIGLKQWKAMYYSIMPSINSLYKLYTYRLYGYSLGSYGSYIYRVYGI